MNICEFKQEHCGIIAEIARLHHKDSIYRDSEFNAERMVRSLSMQLMNPACKGWALVDNGKCYGGLVLTVGSAYGAFYDVAMDTFYAVLPSAKGRGMSLLREAVKWAKTQPNVKRIVFNLAAGTPDQKRAEDLYRKLGMKMVGSTWSMEV